ncbi:wolframin ER transmembrane glycoprotein wfs1 [Rhynchophorus ferrugineus]|uniref:wolframin ER transmembrane glycoprotein wfs1 n=1 Tax=Rhynchophorus ferrugineus TaxID=354439 RepID=UPI003FCE82AF
MAGVIPKKSSSGRKQWSLHGAQRISLKGLRSQLAADGCPESQVVLAKLLFEECEFKSDQKENAKQGVYWLIKASEQGNLEATDLLKKCLETGRGINEHNFIDVKTCISMTQDEKIVRRAAKEMFANLANGGEYITSNQLQRKILSIERGESCSKSTETRDLENHCQESNGEISNNYDDSSGESDEETDWSIKSDLNNEKLTEDKVVSAAITFSHGHLPVVNNILSLTEPNLNSLDHIPFLYRSILHPILFLKIVYLRLIKFLGSKSMPIPLGSTNTQGLALLLIYSLVSFDNVKFFLPTVGFYASFVMMIVATCQMLQVQRELHEFRLWRGLFICYSNGDLNEQSFESQFIINHTRPYIWYFFSLLVHYFCFSLTPVKLESELTVMSCCFMFVTLFGLMARRRDKTVLDPLVLLSFAVNILARYPYDTDPIVSRGWRYLELNVPSFPSYVVGNGIEFCISFRLVLYAIIPALLARMAARDRWKGSYKVLLPHLVTLSWLQYFAVCSHNATMYGLYRATLALVGSVVFLPLVGLMSVILPVAAITKWVISSNLIYSIGLFLFLLMICLAVCYACAKTKYAPYTAALQVVLMLIAFFALLKSSLYNGNLSNEYPMGIETKTLDWDSFESLCYKKMYHEKENRAEAQLRCAELEGSQVFWEATVTEVKLTSITNKYKSVIDKFPKFLSDYLRCFYGKPVKTNCDQDDAGQISDCMILQESYANQCTLKDHNAYTFEVSLKMSSFYWTTTPIVHLHLAHEFTNFTLRLRSKDEVWFKGRLYNNHEAGAEGLLGSVHIFVHGEEIGCISCADYQLTSVKTSERDMFSFVYMLHDGFKFILNVLFNPVLIFK